MGRRRSLVDKFNRAERKMDNFTDRHSEKLRDIDGKMDPATLTPEEKKEGGNAYRDLSIAERKLRWLGFTEGVQNKSKKRRNHQNKRSQ